MACWPLSCLSCEPLHVCSWKSTFRGNTSESFDSISFTPLNLLTFCVFGLQPWKMCVWANNSSMWETTLHINIRVPPEWEACSILNAIAFWEETPGGHMFWNYIDGKETFFPSWVLQVRTLKWSELFSVQRADVSGFIKNAPQWEMLEKKMKK